MSNQHTLHTVRSCQREEGNRKKDGGGNLFKVEVIDILSRGDQHQQAAVGREAVGRARAPASCSNTVSSVALSFRLEAKLLAVCVELIIMKLFTNQQHKTAVVTAHRQTNQQLVLNDHLYFSNYFLNIDWLQKIITQKYFNSWLMGRARVFLVVATTAK